MEVMVVVGITGILLTSALAPMVYTVRLLKDTQKQYATDNKWRLQVSRLFADFSQTLPLQDKSTVILKDGKSILMWTLTPSLQGKPAGCVVFSVVSNGGYMKAQGGLYRWFLPEVLNLEDVDITALKIDSATLVLPGVDAMHARVWDEKQWTEDYKGKRPQALEVTVKGENRELSFVDWMPH